MNKKCLNCESVNIKKVEYGELTEEFILSIEKGEILHGGCAIKGLMPAYYCLDCDTRFDDECSQEFIDALVQIELRNQNVVINFKQSWIKINQFKETLTDLEISELKKCIKASQIEYFKPSINGNLVCTFSHYFVDELKINANLDKCIKKRMTNHSLIR